MDDDLCKYIVQFYRVLGIGIFFDNVSFPTECICINKELVIDPIKITKNEKPVTFTNNIKNIEQYNSNPALVQLLQEINNIDCLIRHTARNTVIFDGDIHSNVMIIGEAPGQEEDIQCKPFVGQSGILLNNMLRAIGLSRETVIISNIVFWRPPFNRTPSTDEISLCLPYVKRLIGIIKPKVLLLLGAVSNHALLNTIAPMSKLRGTMNNILGIKTVSTYHPAYLLRSSSQKKYAFYDFLLLKRIISEFI